MVLDDAEQLDDPPPAGQRVSRAGKRAKGVDPLAHRAVTQRGGTPEEHEHPFVRGQKCSPTIVKMRRNILKLWKSIQWRGAQPVNGIRFHRKGLNALRGEVKNPRGFVGKGYFMVRVDSQEELEVVLRRRAWHLGGRTLVASRWIPGMAMNVEETIKEPIWIRLPNLPSIFWCRRVFAGILRAMGAELVEADPFTKTHLTLGFARLCIDVPLN
ncbi:hypothetical protein EJ110_NYTH08889 [Nymphaea thermarum]|nr:hypothetical protein EJ110_NYTH08889 [Nymphaea thermarum]